MSRPSSELKTFKIKSSILRAGAGAGKTTTLIRLFEETAMSFKKEKGYEEWLLSKAHVDVTPLVIITDPKELEISPGKPGPYVAEAHSHGTLFKHGFGLFLGLDLSDREYNWGRLPLETVEQLLGIKPYSLTIEKYGKEFKEIEGALKKVGVPSAMKKSSDFYRFHRIQSTGWPTLLFGAKGQHEFP